MKHSRRFAKQGVLSLALWLFLSCWMTTLQAVPAKRIVRTVMQPDGSTISTVLQGDELFHYLSTTDGIMIQKAPDGFMKYATVNSRGLLSAGEFIAHDPTERTEAETAYIEKIDNTRIENAVTQMRSRPYMPQRQTEAQKSKFPNQGTVKGLIILAQYQDVKFSDGNTNQEFHDMMNVEGYSKNGASGSARDYFIDQSSGLFTPEFDVVGPVTLPKKMSYYGANNYTGQDQNPAEMVVDACYIADTLLNVDFSQYDFDDDGKVDLVFIIYAGYAEAQGGPANSIWPHAWTLENAKIRNVRMDGKLINSYACTAELSGSTGTTIDGIGTFCHEFSHCLGLPDIYDTRYSGLVGMGAWSLMDYGAYNNRSRTPAGYSAYERYSVGWLTPTELTEPQRNLQLSPMNTTNKAYMIRSDENPDEYYTIENRQNTGWDKHLPGHGMVIVHVDYVPSIWEDNVVNSATSKYAHLQIVPADNELVDFTGDGFPGKNKNTAFADDTRPAAKLNTGEYLGKPISKIEEKDGIITFDFMYYIATPVAQEATDIEGDHFTAHWTPVKLATEYTLKVAAGRTGKAAIKEDFSKCTEGSIEVPDGQDIASSLDKYTSTPQWTGEEIYQAGGYCRIGSKESQGKLITPLLDFSGEKEFTLCCNAIGSKNLFNGFEFGILDTNGNVLQSKIVIMNTKEQKIYWILNVEGQTGYVYIKTKAPAYFNEISIYNGNVRESLEKEEPLPEPEEFSKEIKGITETSCVVTGLKGNKRYIYNVIAQSGEEASALSNKVMLQTTEFSGIASASATDREVHTQKGAVRFVTDSAETVRICTISGMPVYSGTSHEGANNIPLPEGLYILSIGTERYKILIL